jgi:hypothetical protein
MDILWTEPQYAPDFNTLPTIPFISSPFAFIFKPKAHVTSKIYQVVTINNFLMNGMVKRLVMNFGRVR